MLNLKRFKKIYFVGVKGAGMTSLAVFGKQMGKVVIGSDIAENFVTDRLLWENKIKILPGFSKQNIIDWQPDLAIATGAHGGLQNEEAVQAKKMNIPILLQGEAVGYFADSTGQKQIAVAGTHGKTTASAMIAHILFHAKLDPSFLIGAEIKSLKTSGRFGKGKYFIVEADEYVSDPQSQKRPKFLYLNPDIAVVTNVDFDHPDVFKDIEHVKKAFADFAQKISNHGLLIACVDDANTKSVLKSAKAEKLTYGFSKDADLKITHYSFQNQTSKFKLEFQNKDLGEFALKIPGKQNIQNAAGAVLTCLRLKLSIAEIKKAIFSYHGTKRRFEKIFSNGQFSLYDDYAHHPTEIAKTLEAARLWFGKKRIIAVFQPHTYSRTKALLERFSTCFFQADLVIIADIYASLREKKDPQINSRILTEKIKKYHKNVIYGGTIENTAKKLAVKIKKGDLIITMGAGDIYRIHEKITADS